MLEAEWLSCGDSFLLAAAIVARRIPVPDEQRHLRLSQLAAVALARRLNDALSEVHRHALDLAEAHACERITIAALGTAISGVHRTRRKRSDVDHAVYGAVRFPCHLDSVARHVATHVAHAAGPARSPTAISAFSELLQRYVTSPVAPNADRVAFDAAFAAEKAQGARVLREVFGNPYP